MKLLAALTCAGLLPLATAFPAPTDSSGASASGCKSGGEKLCQRADTKDDNPAGNTTTAFAVEKLLIKPRVTKCLNNGKNIYDCPNDVNIITHLLTPSITQTVSWNVKNAPSAECATQTSLLAVGKRDEVKQDGHDGRENKRYECSNSRIGVLVCRYGFCAIEFYCEEGMRCSDECACCKDASVVEMEMGAVA